MDVRFGLCRRLIDIKWMLLKIIVLRILSALHRNEAQKLSSAYNILPAHSRNIDIKRAVWSSFDSLFTI